MVIEAARNLAGLEDAEQHRVRPGHAAPGDLHDGRPGGRRRRRARHGRHHAARPLPGRARPRARSSAELYGAAKVGRAPPPPLRGQQRLPRAAGGGRPGLLRPVARRPPGRVRRAARATCTRSSSAPRRTRSSGPGRPGRTRCSAASIGAALAYADCADRRQGRAGRVSGRARTPEPTGRRPRAADARSSRRRRATWKVAPPPSTSAAMSSPGRTDAVAHAGRRASSTATSSPIRARWPWSPSTTRAGSC